MSENCHGANYERAKAEADKIDAKIIDHRPLYLFGLNLVGEKLTPQDKTNKAKKSHEAFVEKNLLFY